jgi:DNA-binding HxlR family transcriptional regulator
MVSFILSSRYFLVTTEQNQLITKGEPCDLDACAVRDTLLIIGGKWKSIIMHTMHNQGTIRFNLLKKSLPDISQKMLTQQLRELERDGLIKRVDYEEMPPRVEYSLTDLGRSAGSVYKAINIWQKEHLKTINNNRKNYDESKTDQA